MKSTTLLRMEWQWITLKSPTEHGQQGPCRRWRQVISLYVQPGSLARTRSPKYVVTAKTRWLNKWVHVDFKWEGWIKNTLNRLPALDVPLLISWCHETALQRRCDSWAFLPETDACGFQRFCFLVFAAFKKCLLDENLKEIWIKKEANGIHTRNRGRFGGKLYGVFTDSQFLKLIAKTKS